VEGECVIAFDTWDGRHYEGTVSASYSRTEPTYLMLTGVRSRACPPLILRARTG